MAFYIKESDGAQGEGISILTREQLFNEYSTLQSKGYDVERGSAGDIVIQRAVTDFHTVQYGPIAKRRYNV